MPVTCCYPPLSTCSKLSIIVAPPAGKTIQYTLADFLSSGWTRKKLIRLSRETVNEDLNVIGRGGGGRRGNGCESYGKQMEYYLRINELHPSLML